MLFRVLKNMKCKIKISAAVICSVSAVLLSACYPTGVRDTRENLSGLSEGAEGTDDSRQAITRLVDIPDKIYYENDNITIDAFVEVGNKNAKLCDLSVERKSFDLEDVKKIVPEGEEFTRNLEANEDVYVGSKGSIINLRPASVYFLFGETIGKDYSTALGGGYPFDDRYIIDNGVFAKEEIEGLSRQEVIDKAKEWLKSLGIEALQEPKTATLDYETLKSFELEEEEMLKEGKAFELSDEGYYLVFRSEYDGIPFLAQDYYLQDKAYCWASIVKMIVNRSGLVELSVEGMYDITGESETEQEIYDFNAVIEKLASKYKDIMLAAPVKVSRIELIYAPDVISQEPLTYRLSPCWAVYVSSGASGRTDDVVYYSAVTGEEIAIE